MAFIKRKDFLYRFLFACAVFLALLFVVDAPAFAQNGAGSAGGETGGTVEKQLESAGSAAQYSLRNPGLFRTAIVIIRLVLGVVGTLFFAMLVYGGYRWMTAGGNEDAITEAKGTIKNAIIGMTVIFASYAITIAVTNVFLPATTSEGGRFEIQFQPGNSSSDGLKILK